MVWWMGGKSGGNGFDTNSILFHLEMCSILSDSWCDYSIVRIFFFLLSYEIELFCIAFERVRKLNKSSNIEE